MLASLSAAGNQRASIRFKGGEQIVQRLEREGGAAVVGRNIREFSIMAEDTIEPSVTTTTKPKPTGPAKAAATSAGPEASPTADAVLAIDTMPPMDDAAGPNAARALKDGAAKLAKEATGKARDYIEEGKNRAGGALDEVSRLMGDAATTVDERLGPQYGQYARSAAEGIAGFSESLKGKEIEDLLADAQQLVRKSPAVAIGVAAALGFVVARLVKAGLEPASPAADSGDAASTDPTKSSTTASSTTTDL